MMIETTPSGRKHAGSHLETDAPYQTSKQVVSNFPQELQKYFQFFMPKKNSVH